MRVETAFAHVGDLIGVDAVIVGHWEAPMRSEVSTLGFSVSDLRIVVADLGYGIDGVLGMDFLRLFNVEIRPAERRILVERITA